MVSIDFDEVGIDSVRPRDEGLDMDNTSCIPNLKSLSLTYQCATVGNSDEGFISVSPLRNLSFISPLKQNFSGSRYFLRSCTKFNGNYLVSSGYGVGRGVSGLSSAGPLLKESEQFNVNGVLRAVFTPALVTL